MSPRPPPPEGWAGAAWGWTAGAGVDWALTNNLIARFDWAYQNYGTFTINGTGAFNGTQVSATANTFTLGLAMKF